MATESGRLLAGQGQGKRGKGRNKFHPSPNPIGTIHYYAGKGLFCCSSQIPNCLPIPKLHDYLSVVVVFKVDQWYGGPCLSCYQCKLCILVFMSPSSPVSLIDLTSSCLCFRSPPISPGSFASHNLGDDNIWMFNILFSCQSMSPHWIHLNL
jgi:hypothetical protein